MSATTASGALALAWLVSEVPGWLVARAVGWRTDRFTRLWIGIVLTSIVGLVLAELRWFSLATLLAGLAAAVLIVSALLAAAGWRPAPTAAGPGAGRRETALAALAGVALVAWSWPPYETLIAASDSTMYVNAGIHLAASGSLAVPDTITPMLPRDDARALFASIGFFDAGPYIRLPGGLLMPTLESPDAVPAFFPLLPVWTGIMALAGGPAAATLVAPLFGALAVAAVVLFAAETLGLVAGAVTGLLLLANFAIWWFARFTMPEPLAMAAIWGGLVMLRRAVARDEHDVHRPRMHAFLAGAILGLAGLARTETLLFLLAAGALAWSWGSLRAPLPLLAGFASLASLTVLHGVVAPSHHLAYLRNDLALQYVVLYNRVVRGDVGPLWVAVAAIPVAALIGGTVIALRSGLGVVRGVAATAVPIAVVIALFVYVLVGGRPMPARHLSWLGAYCSWPLLALASLGAIVAWRRGGAAMHVAMYAWALAALVFVLNPRVAEFQPWAIRRFVPFVIPGIAVFAGALVGWMVERRGRPARVAAVVVALLVVLLEGRTILPARALPYYAGSVRLVDALVERLPPNALVAMDGDLADIQIQVPLWLQNGFETVMLNVQGRRWADTMRALLGSGRPVIWIGNALTTPPDPPGVHLAALLPDPEIAVAVPDAPADVPPSGAVTRRVMLRVYRVSDAPVPGRG